MDLLTVVNKMTNYRLCEDMAGYLFFQLLEAVSHLHESGICHRDIKLENCMLCTETMQLKLVDFGMSKELQSVCTVGYEPASHIPFL